MSGVRPTAAATPLAKGKAGLLSRVQLLISLNHNLVSGHESRKRCIPVVRRHLTAL